MKPGHLLSRLGIKIVVLSLASSVLVVSLFGFWINLEMKRSHREIWKERMLGIAQSFSSLVDKTALIENDQNKIIPDKAWGMGMALFSSNLEEIRYALAIFRRDLQKLNYEYSKGGGNKLNIHEVPHQELISHFKKGELFFSVKSVDELINVAVCAICENGDVQKKLGFIAFLFPESLILDDWQHTQKNLILSIIGFLAIGFLIALIVSCFLVSHTVPLIHSLDQGMEKEMQRLRQKAFDTHKETEELVKTLQKNTNELRNAARETLGINEGLIHAFQETSTQINIVAQSLEKQKVRTERMNSSLSDMSTAVKEVASNAEAAVSNSQTSLADAKRGGEVVNKIIKHMNKITQTVAKSAEVIRELGKRSDEIGDIIDVIDDIADQTNLLALNAAIEAARAGKQGRGFEVVADEVRKLAEKTTHATKEIAATINSIQDETTRAGAAMEDGIREIDIGAGFAVQAGVSLQKIVAGAKRVMDMISAIAEAAEKQAKTAEIISRLVEEISRGAEKNTEETMFIAQKSKDLSSRIDELYKKTQVLSRLWRDDGKYDALLSRETGETIQKMHEWQELLRDLK